MKKCIVFVILFMLMSVNVYALDTSANCAVLIETTTGTVLYEKNAHTKTGMASTTKIMTALLALEKSKPDDIVTISRNAANTEGSSLYLKPGDKIRMIDLVYGLMLNSGNDAAVAIAEHICGNVQEFAKGMTKKARDLGLENTSFKNPNGLDADGHYTTAYDLAQITRYAMQNENFEKIVSTKKYTAKTADGTDMYFVNHNKLLSMYEGCIGVKTGYTKSTGRCLVSCAERNGIRFIAVTLGSPDDWNDHKKMLDYAFSRYESKDILKENQIIKTVTAKNSDGVVVNVIPSESFSVPIRKGENNNITVKLKMNALYAPVNKGEKVGVLEVYNGDNLLASIDAVSDKDVYAVTKQKKGYFNSLIKILQNWMYVF